MLGDLDAIEAHDRPDREFGPFGYVDRVGDGQLVGIEPEQQHRERGEVRFAARRSECHHASLAVVPAGDPERLRVAGKAEDRLTWPSAEDRVEFGRGFGSGVVDHLGKEQFDCSKARGFLAGAGKFERERD